MTLTFTKFKKGIALVAVFLMLFTIIPMNANAMETASDISGHWAEETIQEWIDNDWVKGYLDGSFKPDDHITRAEFVALVNRSFQFTATGSTSFTDVNQNAWYASAVGIAVRAGYIQGYNDNTMRPENNISREEAATIIMKINNLSANSTAANVFTDSGLLTWSRGAVGSVAAVNLMTGYPDGTFGPDRMIRRGETVVLLDRSVKYIDEMDAPAAPDVTRDDAANTVTGMTSAMEYKLDNGLWTAYVASAFNDLNLSGNHTLLVRYAAIGILPAGMITTLTFTTASTGGGGGNDDIDVTSINVTGSAIMVGTTLSAITVPDDATVTYEWSIATTKGGIYVPIDGATDETYIPVSTDATKYVRVAIVGIGNYTGTETSAAIGPIALSNNAGLTSVLGQIGISPAGGNGETTGAAITWNINVANAVGSVAVVDISVADGASANLYIDAGFTQNGVAALTLTEGGTTTAYIKVTAQDTTTIKYYTVAIHRAVDVLATNLIADATPTNINAVLDVAVTGLVKNDFAVTKGGVTYTTFTVTETDAQNYILDMEDAAISTDVFTVTITKAGYEFTGIEVTNNVEASIVATLTSTIGTVDNDAGTIVGIPNGTTLANFKAAITPATGATFEVYEADGITVATDLASTYKVIVTAEDTLTTMTYTVTVL